MAVIGSVFVLLVGACWVGVIYSQWLEGQKKPRRVVGILLSVFALVMFSTICVLGGV